MALDWRQQAQVRVRVRVVVRVQEVVWIHQHPQWGPKLEQSFQLFKGYFLVCSIRRLEFVEDESIFFSLHTKLRVGLFESLLVLSLRDEKAIER